MLSEVSKVGRRISLEYQLSNLRLHKPILKEDRNL